MEMLLGALLAGLVGVLTTLFLEGLRTDRERRTVCAVVAREIARMVDWRMYLLDRPNKNIVYGRLVPVNTFISGRLLLARKVLNDTTLTFLESMYRDYETRDRMMSVYAEADVAGNARLRESAREAYWSGLADPKTEKEAARVTAVMAALERFAGAGPWGRLTFEPLKMQE